MAPISDKQASPPPDAALFTVTEAAWIADTGDSFVNHEVDHKIIPIPHRRGRLLSECDIFYLCAVREGGTLLKLELRRQIYQAVRRYFESGGLRRVSLGHWVLFPKGIKGEIDPRLATIKAARSVVEIRPGVRGGEPVIRGTRIPVRTLAEMARAGAATTELAQEYDLSPSQVELALLYDKLHPRRGRPPKNQDHADLTDLGPHERADVEELGVFKHHGISHP